MYLAADRGYLEQAQERGLTARIVPFARQHPVIAVRTGNPHQIRSLEDLTRDQIRVTLPDPERAAIGRIAKSLLESESSWEPIWRHAILQRATVNDVANDIKLESADAGIVWNTTAAQYPELDAIEIPEFESAESEIGIAILKTSKQQELTKRFIADLLDENIGQAIFARYGYGLISREGSEVTP